MDEALRRAYLAAMEIPVWIPRGEADPLVAALEPADRAAQERNAPTAPAPPGARTTSEGPSAGGRAQAILQEFGPARAERVAHGGSVRAPAARPAAPPAVSERFVLLFARAGGTLFVDDSAGERATRRELELLAALSFVLEREQLQPELHPFAWPPHAGRAAGEAGDALLGRIARFAEGMALRRLVLMGERAARLLLGETADPRSPRVHRLERPACAVLVIPSLARMLEDPDAKRIAWQTLRLPHG